MTICETRLFPTQSSSLIYPPLVIKNTSRSFFFTCTHVFSCTHLFHISPTLPPSFLFCSFTLCVFVTLCLSRSLFFLFTDVTIYLYIRVCIGNFAYISNSLWLSIQRALSSPVRLPAHQSDTRRCDATRYRLVRHFMLISKQIIHTPAHWGNSTSPVLRDVAQHRRCSCDPVISYLKKGTPPTEAVASDSKQQNCLWQRGISVFPTRYRPPSAADWSNTERCRTGQQRRCWSTEAMLGDTVRHGNTVRNTKNRFVWRCCAGPFKIAECRLSSLMLLDVAYVSLCCLCARALSISRRVASLWWAGSQKRFPLKKSRGFSLRAVWGFHWQSVSANGPCNPHV